MALPGWHSLRELLGVILRSSRRLAVLVVGTVLVLAGVAMLVLPGPGIVVIIAGLAVLATEFVWAEHLLDQAQAHARRAGQAATRTLRRRASPSSD